MHGNHAWKPAAKIATRTPCDYRDSEWWRSLFILQPDVEAVQDANVLYQIHAIVAWAFWAVFPFPFSRLVHAWSICCSTSAGRTSSPGAATRRAREGREDGRGPAARARCARLHGLLLLPGACSGRSLPTSRTDLGLSDFQTSAIVAVPVLLGSLMRIPLGRLTDHRGGRRVFTALMAYTPLPRVALAVWHDSLAAILVLG